MCEKTKPTFNMKIAFLDRDGTIVQDYPDHEWSHITEPEFLTGSIDALKGIQTNGFQIIIISNQYLIDEGFITQNQYQQFSDKMLDTLISEHIDILDIFYCPHRRDSGCRSCKPMPGMIEQAIEKYPGINLKESFIAGDAECDALLAARLDMRFFGIKIQSTHIKAHSVNSLLEIFPYLN